MLLVTAAAGGVAAIFKAPPTGAVSRSSRRGGVSPSARTCQSASHNKGCVILNRDGLRIHLEIFGCVVFGHDVSYVIEGLRHFDQDGFDAWWRPWRDEMATDPLLRYFHKLRTQILKRGGPLHIVEYADDHRPILRYPEPPTEHRGLQVTNTELDHLCSLYLKYMTDLRRYAVTYAWELHERLDTEKAN